MTKEEFMQAQRNLGLTNMAMARLLGCSLSTIVKYRIGSHPVSPDTSLAIHLILAWRE